MVEKKKLAQRAPKSAPKPSNAELDRSWAELETLAPKKLRPGATAAAIASLRKAVGDVPDVIVASLQRHDGSRGMLVVNEVLLPASGIVKFWKRMVEMQKNGFFDDPNWWRASWLPLSDADGDAAIFDRETGSIFEFGNSSGRSPRPVARDYPSWLAKLARGIKVERREAAKEKRAIEVVLASAKTPAEAEHLKNVAAELGGLWGFFFEPRPRKYALHVRPVNRSVSAEELIELGLRLGVIREEAGIISRGKEFS